MTDEQKVLIESLFYLSTEYYTEKDEDGYLQMPDNQHEKDFIREVFMTMWSVLDKDNENKGG